MIKRYELVGKNYNDEDAVICLFSGEENDLVAWLRAMIEQGPQDFPDALEVGEISEEQYKMWSERQSGWVLLSKNRRKVIDLIK